MLNFRIFYVFGGEVTSVVIVADSYEHARTRFEIRYAADRVIRIDSI